MNPKYELLPSEIPGLHRIRALRDFGDVRAGDIGGLIESESNLSHYGNAWVYDNARVSDNAWVYDNARVSDNARVYDNARVAGNARVIGNAHVSDNAHVVGDACVAGNAHVYGDARVYGYAWVGENAHVYGDAYVHDDAWVFGDARVCDDESICSFSHVGNEIGILTAFTTERGIYCTNGYFKGPLDDFEAAVRETHGDSQIAREYALLIEFIRLRLGGRARGSER